jgi:hypothetical protein
MAIWSRTFVRSRPKSTRTFVPLSSRLPDEARMIDASIILKAAFSEREGRLPWPLEQELESVSPPVDESKPFTTLSVLCGGSNFTGQRCLASIVKAKMI